ncbi:MULTISPECIES: hypothetical protein [unclassified Crossiella]|uniref:hypothetical protein n=1 Tax=unclassified Crossiella TaxID=2620835 RepID=UPI001FFF2961|nr:MULTISPECIES: hypothetical protein [unclassified Crossiella]MCK2237712.1 hypothetical protein [Crossiella sp. S99.2]MCK2254998.1 hypothetical protein [Crossiella sp. S99.1]
MRRAIIGTPDEVRAASALVDASNLVRAEVPPAKLAPIPPAVVTIVCKAAGREVNNPNGFSAETAGDYSYRLGEAAVTGVYLTTDELAVLRKIAGRSGLRSTRTPYGGIYHSPPHTVVPVISPDGRPAEPMPWWEVTD